MHHTIDHQKEASKPPKRRSRVQAAGAYRSARNELGLTQAEAAELSGCGERSQRDRELGDCSLGALEGLFAMAARKGKRPRIVFEPYFAPANDNAEVSPPSCRPGLARCAGPIPSKDKVAL